MRHDDDPLLVRVLEDVMRSPYAVENPPIRLEKAYQGGAFHGCVCYTPTRTPSTIPAAAMAHRDEPRYNVFMPELPEVETVRLGLVPVLEGRVLTRAEPRRADLRRPFPPDFRQALTGQRVTRLARRAKYLLVHLTNGRVLIVHLGMSGSIRVHQRNAPPPDKHDHVVFETDAGATLYFNDPRRFGVMDLADEAALADHPMLRGLGPEPLDPAFDGAALSARLAGRRTSLKAALMDQGTVAGLGNIYVCEALFRAGLSPKRRADTVPGVRAARLVDAIKAVLAEAIASGGSSLRDHMQVNGELGYFQHTFAVYGREGEPCPGCTCGGGVKRLVQQGRSTFYCATRQR